MKRALIALAALLLAASGCGRRAGAQLRVTGSSTLAPVVAALARAYEARHPGVRIDVEAGGSSRGVADARTGRAGLGLVSRALHPDEADLTGHLLGHDAVVVITHASRPLPGLTRAQLIAVYSGAISDWAGLGGPAGAIVVVSKAEGRSTLEVFLEFTGLSVAALRPSVIIGDNAQGIKTVVGNPDAIGYVSIGAALAEIGRGAPLHLVPLDGLAPTPAAVAAGALPMARALNLVHRRPASALAADFVAFTRTEEGRALVESAGFVPAP